QDLNNSSRCNFIGNIEALNRLDYYRLDSVKITRYTMYLVGFAKIEIKMDFDTIKGAIEEAKPEMLIALPDHP
ncbi:3888_t:CDS:2, partial [Gigaspora rosea]